MDTFVDSSWYSRGSLRHTPTPPPIGGMRIRNECRQYIGGIEHCDFATSVFALLARRLQITGTCRKKQSSPFNALFTQGMVTHGKSTRPPVTTDGR